jgi:hypothetical protein
MRKARQFYRPNRAISDWKVPGILAEELGRARIGWNVRLLA